MLDRPSPPLGPVEFKDVNIDTVTLTWNPPEDDGGCPVNSYIVELSEVGHPGFKVYYTLIYLSLEKTT